MLFVSKDGVFSNVFCGCGKNHTPSKGIKITATTQLQSNAAALTQKISPAYSPVVDLAIPTGKKLAYNCY